MICSSVNRLGFMVHPFKGDGLYPFLEEFAGLRPLNVSDFWSGVRSILTSWQILTNGLDGDPSIRRRRTTAAQQLQ
jgi:hypothetical protein